MEYTQEQFNVAEDRSSRLLVRALAGTGKTETVALRIQSLIDGGTKPEAIQTLCFTRTARSQLRKRLDAKGLHAVRVNTVHSVAWSIIEKWCASNEREMPPVISGEKIAAESLLVLGIVPSDSNVNSLLRLSNAGWNGSFDGVSLGNMRAEEMRESVELYRQMKKAQGVYDFDDLIALAGRIAPKKFEEVIVDEAQDLSALQVRLVEGLSYERMTWVGDSNQAVFAFAGVDGGLFSGLDGWQSLTLSKSFRSTEEILSVANQVSSHDLHSGIHGGSVEVAHVGYEDVAGRIVRDSIDGDSQVVIGRTRNGLERIAVALEGSGRVVQRSWEEKVMDAEITVSTVHKAKGDEWEKVTVVDLMQSGFDGCDITEEEKRLFYVAVTRAKKTLTLMTLDGVLPWNVATQN